MRLNNTCRALCAGALALAVFSAAPAIARADDEENVATNEFPVIEATLDNQSDLESSVVTPEQDVTANAESGSDDVIPVGNEDETTIVELEPAHEDADSVATDETPEGEVSDEQSVSSADSEVSEGTAPESEAKATSVDADAESPAAESGSEEEGAPTTAPVSDPVKASITAAAPKAAASTGTVALKAQADNNSSKEDGKRTIADGVYVFNTALKNKVLISTAKNSGKAGANVQLNADDGTLYQRWMVKYVSDGYYTIVRRATSMALTIIGNKAAAGTNVQLAKNTKADGQLWKFVPMSDGYYQLVSKLRSNLVLDVAGAKSANGTNIRIARDNNGKGQQFKLYKANAAAKSNVDLDDATYTIRYTANTSYMVDIAGGSRENGANVYLRKSNGTQQQKYRFTSDNQGYYIITDIGTGKVLSTENASVLSGNNIKQAKYTGAAIQLWSVRKNGDSYRVVNKATGLSLALRGGVIANGSNIQAMVNSKSNAQKFTIKRTRTLTDGIYTINSFKNFDSVFNMKGGSAADYTPVQLQTVDNMSLSQRFQVLYVGLVDGEEIYRIRTGASGGWLTYTDAKGLVQYGNHATKVQDSNSWKVISNGGYFSLSNVSSGRVFNLRGGRTANGTAVQALASNKSAAQHFYFTPTNLLGEGSYHLVSGLGTTALAVKGNSTASGANVQANAKTAGLYQMYTLSSTGKTNSTYYLTNFRSGKVVAVAGSATTRGANVVQSTKTGAKSEQWIAQISDGGYVRFVNANSGLILAVAGNKKNAGTNVQQNAACAVDGQRWKPTPMGWTTANGTYEFYDSNGVKVNCYDSNGAKIPWSASSHDSWNRIKNMTSRTIYLGTVDKGRTTVTFFTRKNNMWMPYKSWRCSVGKATTPTPSGTFRVFNRRPYVEADWYCCWYWTYFTRDWRAFHSIPCKPGTKIINWGGTGEYTTGGCVRSPYEMAKWVYDYAKNGTTIHVYD